MPLSPPLCLRSYFQNTSSSGNDHVTTLSIDPQTYTSSGVQAQYNGNNIAVGMYATSNFYGMLFRVKSISSQTSSSVTAVLEDINGFNKIINVDGDGNGAPFTGWGYIFELNDDGLPALTAVNDAPTITFPDSILGRFIYDRSNATYRSARLYARGTGANNPASRLVVLNGVELVNTSLTGLTLTIINGATLAHVSSTHYNTNGLTTASDGLATALNGLTRQQIGVLTSSDAWQANVTTNLLNAAIRLGLSKLGGFRSIPANRRRPYAAIFYGGGTDQTVPTREVVERIESFDEDAPVASIFVELTTDGTYGTINGANSTNALYNPNAESRTPALFVDSNERIGIGTIDPLAKLQVVGTTGLPEELPIANPSSDTYFSTVSRVPNNTATNVLMDIGSHTRTSGGYGNIYRYRLGFVNETNGTGGSFRIIAVPTASSTYNSDGTAVTRLAITPTGNVGIGTNGPIAGLDVGNLSGNGGIQVFGLSGNNINRPAIQSSSSDAANTPAYEIRSNTVNGGDGFLRIRSGGIAFNSANSTSYIDLSGFSTVSDMDRNVVLGTLGTERMRIHASGMVRILKDGTTDPAQWGSNNGNIDTLVLQNTGDYSTAASSGRSASIFFANNTLNYPQARIASQMVGVTPGGYSSNLIFQTNSGGTGLAERMRIHTNGNIGIGTASSTANNTFQVDRDDRTGTHNSNLAAYFTKSTSTEVDPIIDVRHANGTQGVGIGWQSIVATGSNASQNLGYYTKGSGLHIFTDLTAGERMRIDTSTGRVGIGTNNPTTALDVNGVIRGRGSIVNTVSVSANPTSSWTAYSTNFLACQINYTPVQSGTVSVIIHASAELTFNGGTGFDGLFRDVNLYNPFTIIRAFRDNARDYIVVSSSDYSKLVINTPIFCTQSGDVYPQSVLRSSSPFTLDALFTSYTLSGTSTVVQFVGRISTNINLVAYNSTSLVTVNSQIFSKTVQTYVQNYSDNSLVGRTQGSPQLFGVGISNTTLSEPTIISILLRISGDDAAFYRNTYLTLQELSTTT